MLAASHSSHMLSTQQQQQMVVGEKREKLKELAPHVRSQLPAAPSREHARLDLESFVREVPGPKL